MFCPYVRNNPKIDKKLKTNNVDINRKAQLDFRKHAKEYFKSATFKASNARILKSYGGGGAQDRLKNMDKEERMSFQIFFLNQEEM